ncbi:MAG: hypothetical protein FJ387_12020 [Verrucomicrobia bacterium]|nr:hypothetical protein [Verrucomicrobiota bacterium]
MSTLLQPQFDGTLAWTQLVGLEPDLAYLLEEIRQVHDDGATPSFCANRLWVERFKPHMYHLVGWGRPDCHPVLVSSEAYELAYRILYRPLPPCRNCGCL